jgi:predicted DNA-binding protein YlxM (UPF0122 family)
MSNKKHPQAKLTHAQVRSIRKKLAAGVSLAELAREYEINRNVIARIRDGLSYKNVE